MSLSRRKVLELSAVMTASAMTGLAGALAAACSDDTGTTNPPPGGGKDAASTPDTGSKADAATDGAASDAPTGVACKSSITQNHGHTIVIPTADLESSTPKTYSILGTSDHDHQITLEPSDFAQLKSKISVKKTSTNGGTSHDHDVTILCT